MGYESQYRLNKAHGFLENGGALRKNEKWYQDGEVIEICTYYKYLGLMMSNRLH